MDGKESNSRQHHHYTVFPVDGNAGNDDVLDQEYNPNPNNDGNNQNAQKVPTQGYSEGTPIIGPARPSENIPIGMPIVDSIIKVGDEEIKLNDNRAVENPEPQRDPQPQLDALNNPLLENFKENNEYPYDMNEQNDYQQNRNNGQPHNLYGRRVQDNNQHGRQDNHWDRRQDNRRDRAPVDDTNMCCYTETYERRRTRLGPVGCAITVVIFIIAGILFLVLRVF